MIVSVSASITPERLIQELDLFKKLQAELKRKRSDFVQLDEHGFALTDSSPTDLKLKIDLLVCGLTHGNEVIGLEIINLMLRDILDLNLPVKFGFLLNNVSAYHKNIRFIEFDLNRSFLSADRTSKLEFKRALEIENIIERLDSGLIIDLHQTVEPTKSAFTIIPEADHLIRMAQMISPEIPIVTFAAAGFSNKGKTLTEYAFSKKIPALVYELGQKGFIRERAEMFKKILINMKLTQVLGAKNDKKTVDYYHIESLIPNQNNLVLEPGLQSYMTIEKDQILAQNKQGLSFKNPHINDKTVIIFPRYVGIEKHDPEIAYLAVQKQLKNDL